MKSITVQFTEDHIKALDDICDMEDEIGGPIDGLSSIANGGDIGWNQSNEMSAHLATLRDALKTIMRAYKVLYPIRAQYETEHDE